MLKNCKEKQEIINTKFKAIVSPQSQAEGSEQDEHTAASDIVLKLVGEFTGIHFIITL